MDEGIHHGNLVVAVGIEMAQPRRLSHQRVAGVNRDDFRHAHHAVPVEADHLLEVVGMLAAQHDPRRLAVTGVELHGHVTGQAFLQRERQQILQKILATLRPVVPVSRCVGSDLLILGLRRGRELGIVDRLDEADARQQV